MDHWDASRYDDDLAKGLALAGEDAGYFAAARVAALRERIEARREIARICEFGCGLGRNLLSLAGAFPAARCMGLDASSSMIERARALNANPRIEFALADAYREDGCFDLVFVNGVMHHVARGERAALMRRLHALLKPGGLLALFDNNPLNPGAMWVMRRIPFDRDAQPVLPWTIAQIARQAGFVDPCIRTYFYFPAPLRALRRAERWLTRLPLGAQYGVYASRSTR